MNRYGTLHGGEGRPGWHIEDTAITEYYFGPQYDVHGGGLGLGYSHHEAEITQMEAVSGKSPMVRYWLRRLVIFKCFRRKNVQIFK